MKPLIALLALCAVAMPVQAQEPAPNIAGVWTFEAQIGNGCSFSGQATVQRKKKTSRYVCELTARQSCPLIDIEYLVAQTCKMTVTGNQVSVRSEIKEFLQGEESPSYYPDSFTLTIRDASTMFGALLSPYGASRAQWRRAEGGIS